MNTRRTVRCSGGIMSHYEIDQQGGVFCTLDESINISKRLQGKKKKYHQVQLNRRGTFRWYYVHRLMAFSWLGEPPHPKRKLVDHRDGNGLNNRIENLRWVTSFGNNVNAKRKGQILEEEGMFYPYIGGHHHRRYKTDDRSTAESMRDLLMECYVRYSMKYPAANSRNVPHYKIHLY